MIMTEYEKMLHNLPYDYTGKEVQANILRAYYAMRDLNQCGAWDMDELHRCIHALREGRDRWRNLCREKH